MKIGQLYNLDSFSRFMKSSKKTGFQDSAGGIILARNLEAVDPKIFEKKYPNLSFFNSGIQIDNTGGLARRIRSLKVIDLGEFKEAGDTAGNKGKISLTAEDSYLPVHVYQAHSEWSDDEVKEAELENINLVSRYIETHNKIYQRDIDRIGYLGLGDAGNGLLTYSGFTSSAATGVIGTLTPQDMYDEIATLITDQWNSVFNIEDYKANRVDMPDNVMTTLTKVMLNTNSGTSTVFKALQDNFPTITFNATTRARDVNGVSVTVAYSDNPDAMIMRIPQTLTVGEIVKQSSFDFRVDTKYRIAGLDVLEDVAGRLLTGL